MTASDCCRRRRYRALIGPVPAAGATGIAGVVAAVRFGPVPAASATSAAGVGVTGAGLAGLGAAHQPAGELRVLELIWSPADLSASCSPRRDFVPLPALPGTAMLPSRVVSVFNVWPAFGSAGFGTATASAEAPVAARVMD